jgi:RimJ/RimL family protein N-acetyltransferase
MSQLERSAIPHPEAPRDLSQTGSSTLLEPLELASTRLELRPLSASDAPLYAALYTDPQTMCFIGPALTQRQAARSFRAALRSCDPPRQGPLYITIIERTSHHPLGLCAIQQIARRSAETGVIISAAARGRGIATESLRAVIGWALSTLPLESIWVRISAHNRIAERLVRAAGLIRQHPASEPQGMQSNEVIWSADRNSWL